MQLAEVVGTVVATVKCEGLEGVKFLIVQPLDRDREPVGRPVVAADAVAAAGVHGLNHQAVILIDLALDWTADPEKPLRVLRLRSDRFDPRALVGKAGSSVQAIGRFVSTLIERTGALALPDPGSARGGPFELFRDLAEYEQQVLRAERPHSRPR